MPLHRYCYTNTDMKHTLEGQKLFQPIAWFLIISFSAFVLHLTLTTRAELIELQTQNAIYEASLGI